eukprot:TRINITY_DN37072_c0_g1_i1.p1 TRINITY_DN37072_c0_g1~~TRINITY_DN37072_c0_g1_i1.p1  ORF type:complete len:484 (-),score=76.43 TRINITY_DN37072_c0_g1_i1:87-1493(-)
MLAGVTTTTGGLASRATHSSCLEALVVARSRTWRLSCDTRSAVETALLHVNELQEGMLLLLEQLGRRVLRPADVGPTWGPPGGWMADVARLSEHAQDLETKLAALSAERAPLSRSLLDATAAGVRLVLESQVSASSVPGTRTVNESESTTAAVRLLATELTELSVDERKLEEACNGLGERVEIARNDLRSLAEARRDLPIGEDGSRASSEAEELDVAGERAHGLLRAIGSCLTSLQTDAHGLLQYLDASDLLRNVETRLDSAPRGERVVAHHGAHAHDRGGVLERFLVADGDTAGAHDGQRASPAAVAAAAIETAARTATAPIVLPLHSIVDASMTAAAHAGNREPPERFDVSARLPLERSGDVDGESTALTTQIGRIVEGRVRRNWSNRVWLSWVDWVRLLRRLRAESAMEQLGLDGGNVVGAGGARGVSTVGSRERGSRGVAVPAANQQTMAAVQRLLAADRGRRT